MTYRAVIDPPGFVIRNTTISVDYWPRTDKIPITHRFLTHAHSDHIKGLDATWTHGTIYCTKITQRLLVDLAKVQAKYIEILETDRPSQFKLNGEQSFQVELIDANHCPGAVMFLFIGYFGTILACGDFRYDPNMFIDTPLSPLITGESSQVVDICYLDNTYCSPEYESIPTRVEALKETISYISLNLDKKIVIKMKKLGKESLIVDLAKHFKCKILLSKERYARYTKVLDLDSSLFTNEFHSSLFIEVEDTDKLYTSVFASRYNFEEVMYIEPTALFLNKSSHVATRQRAPFSRIFHVAYTDHSSYPELLEFIGILKPKLVIATVKEMEANKFNTHVINNMSCFDKFLKKEPLVEAHDEYRLLLQKSSLVRYSTRAAAAAAAPNSIISVTKTRQLRKRKNVLRKIEYETTPVKNTKQNPEKWKQVNENVQVLSEEGEEEPEYVKEDFCPKTTQTNKSIKNTATSSGVEDEDYDRRSIIINHTLDDHLKANFASSTQVNDDKDSYLSARSNSIDEILRKEHDNDNNDDDLSLVRRCLDTNYNENEKELHEFITRLMRV